MANLLNPFIKVAYNQMPESGWTMGSTRSEDAEEEQLYFRLVGVLHRAVELRFNNMRTLPFDLVRDETGEVVDTSEGYENKVGFLPNLPTVLAQIEAATCCTGRAYLVDEGSFSPHLRYMAPQTIQPCIDAEHGLLSFKRSIPGAAAQDIPKSKMLYFWPFDPWVECGPPEHWPVKAALAEAGVIYHSDEFAAAFWERGAIKAMIARVPFGSSEDEKDRLKTWLQRVFAGIRNAMGMHVFEGEGIAFEQIGDGLEALQDGGLTVQERDGVASTMGVPQSLLFSNAANFATASADRKNLYEFTLIPSAQFIADTFYDQLLAERGYKIVLQPDRLECFQEEETDRAGALGAMVAAIQDPVAEVALGVLGYDLSDEQWEILRAYWGKKAAEPPPIPAYPAMPPSLPSLEVPGPIEYALDRPGEEITEELRAWQKKALARVKQGRPIPFTAEFIPPHLAGAIAGMLENADTPDDVKTIFTDVWQNYP